MIDSIALYISSILRLCKKTKFPGTIASFVSLLLSFLSYYFFGKTVYVLFFFIFLILGFWSIKKIHKKIGLGDHQWIGIDELIGMWLANFFLFEFNFTLTGAIIFSLISFTIFRIIDIFKFIPPINIIDKDKNQNAYSVIFDDILGGLYTYFIMLILLGIYNFSFLYSSFLILLTPMIANMVPTLIKTKYWCTPINEKLFGVNKTWRGFLGAIIIGTFSYFILAKLNIINSLNNQSFIFLIGFLFSFGAISGDLIESFFKRKMNINAGESLTPWDQIDFVIGALIMTYPIYHYTYHQIIFLLILGGIISAIAHRIGYLIKINSTKQ